VSIEKAYKLIDEVSTILNSTEGRTIVIKGIRNISISDLDTLIMYAEAYISSGGYNYGNFMEPRGDIEKILDKYGILVEQNKYGW
jgi:hypothetical protein